MRELLGLFLSFAKVGALTFGGGYAMLPMLQREIVDNKGWATEEELMDYYAISQCTPGAIAVNTATFIGQKTRGVPGGIAATLGVVFPSVVIIVLIAAFISNFSDLPLVQNAFAGVRACVCILILNAVVKLWKKSVTGVVTFCIFLAVFLGSVLTDLSPVIFVVLAAIAGIISTNLSAWLKARKGGQPK
jgi:chromate transporter